MDNILIAGIDYGYGCGYSHYSYTFNCQKNSRTNTTELIPENNRFIAEGGSLFAEKRIDLMACPEKRKSISVNGYKIKKIKLI